MISFTAVIDSHCGRCNGRGAALGPAWCRFTTSASCYGHSYGRSHGGIRSSDNVKLYRL